MASIPETEGHRVGRDAPAHAGSRMGDARFFFIMALVMSGVIVAGFSVNLAAGRSTFAVPAVYHIHAGIFMGWLALYCAQGWTIASGRVALHRTLGKLAYPWIGAMLAAGTVVMIVVTQRTGGPFFFHVSEFLFSNIALLWCFGGIALWALLTRRYNGWHRRLLLVSMAILTGPGVGRLLPMPLMIPWAWEISTAVTFLFPAIGMIADKRRRGAVHPAYWWGCAIYAGVFVASLALAFSDWGIGVTQSLIEGTPAAQRPMEAHLPPGFTM
jgi:hypothetical protein